MKKAKIMLLSFALLAIVGGALAFKARSNVNFCTTETNGSAINLCTASPGVIKKCPNFVLSTTVDATNLFCYTTPRNIDGDALNITECSINGANTLNCLQTPTSFKAD